MSRVRLIVVGLLFAIASSADARSRHHTTADRGGSFSYYLLSLSYAPDFCAQSQRDDGPECAVGGRVGFIVHGLWPQGESDHGPTSCRSNEHLSGHTIQAALEYMPTESLVRHEWAAHGTCSGLSPEDYFALIASARRALQIPEQMRAPAHRLELSPSEIADMFAAANPGYEAGDFRVTCYPDRELQEVRVCLTKDDETPRGCGRSAGGCSARTVFLRPVR